MIASIACARTCYYGNTLIRVGLSVSFLVLPLATLVTWMGDPGLRDGRIPRFAYSLHRRLSPRYAEWAVRRVASCQAAALDVEDVPGTEWPLFGSVFYLLSTEALQEAWDADPSMSQSPPREYAHNAIQAATELVIDPNHATWVRRHWGEDYLYRQNCFYRFLYISALTSYERLLGDRRYHDRLADQVERVTAELDESPLGLIDDYPDQCWPTDVVALLAAVRRADVVLGTDHSALIRRARRAFEGRLLDETGLPPYMTDSRTGYICEARGTSSQWGASMAASIWPDLAAQWYEVYAKHFWQVKAGLAGFREFKAGTAHGEWNMDPDSGPILAGFGSATTAFSMGAARLNGRLDHAFPLAVETLAFSWPLPGATLLVPRVLSNGLHAPYVGEASVLYNLTRTPVTCSTIVPGRWVPAAVYVVLGAMAVMILVDGYSIWKRIRRGRAWLAERSFPAPAVQFWAWLVLILVGLGILLSLHLIGGLLCILAGQVLPFGRTNRREPVPS